MLPPAVARATAASDIRELIVHARAEGLSVTPAGGQTSMTAASITDTGVLLSTRPLQRLMDVDPELRIARVEPGLTIGELNAAVREAGLMFAPDPTSENDATIGGAIACNASGARSLRYGPTRDHVAALTVIHADGETATYARSRLEKNTVGYAGAADPIDWFIGSEGTLGVIVEAELLLVPLPAEVTGLAIPFRDERHALEFVVQARRELSRANARRPRCLEFLDAEAARVSARATGQAWDAETAAVIYLEEEGESDSLLEGWLDMAERNDASVSDIRVFSGSQALREARSMRHAVPATLNEMGSRFRAAGGRKISTDWSVPYEKLGDALDRSRTIADAHGIPQPVTYGHAGNGHPHQNFIARDAEEALRITFAVEEMLHAVVAMGGTVSAEHGLGKLKKHWLEIQLGPRQVAVMRAVKSALDPNGVFSPGNIL